MRANILLFFLVSIGLLALKTDKPAYSIFNTEGSEVKYNDMVETIRSADVILFGELHDNPIAHWLEHELTVDLFKTAGKNLILGAEMFEADDQLIIDEYLLKKYEASKFEPEVKLWKNYKTDYKPLMEFARENGLPFIATNIPRRYAAMVSVNGFEAMNGLTDEAKKYIAPLPVSYDPELKCYKDMLSMHAMPGMGSKPNENLPKAQAIKDATMAYFILKNLGAGQTFIHFNGSYHSENYLGIIYYLKLYNPDISIATITTVLQNNAENLNEDNKGLADYIIVVPETMTRTY